MNSELTWLESIIISRNWRAPELASDDNDDQGEERDTQEPGNCSPYASSTQDFFSARSTASGSSLFNPFDSPPLSSFDNLQDLPQLPHLHFDHPSPADVKSQEQQLIDILSKKVDSTTAVARRIAWKVLFEGAVITLFFPGLSDLPSMARACTDPFLLTDTKLSEYMRWVELYHRGFGRFLTHLS